MNHLIQQAKEQIITQIDQHLEREPKLRFYKWCQSIVQESILFIKKEMLNFRFSSQEEEIDFYKTLIPAVLELDIYYGELCDLEIEKASLSMRDYQDYLESELKGIDHFIFKNKTLYTYFLRGDTSLDTHYFTRSGNDASIFDPHFCTLNAYIISKLLALEKLRNIVKFELEASNHPKQESVEFSYRMEFAGTDADLVEIIPALVKLKVIRINGKEATMDQLSKAIDRLFGTRIFDRFSVIDNKNRARKKTTTPFLIRLIEAYEKRTEELLK